MASSETEQHLVVPARVGAAFRLLMQVRIVVVAVSLLLLPADRWTVESTLLLTYVATLSLLAARNWQRIVPQLLRHPLLVVSEIFISFGVLYLGGVLGPFFLSTLISSAVAGLLFRPRGMLAVCMFQILCYYAAFCLIWQSAANHAEMMTFQALLGQPAYYPLAGIAGIALRRLFDGLAAQESARHQAELLAAAAEERARLARELHDSLAKTLHGIALEAEALPDWVNANPRRAEEEARHIRSAAVIASREARSLITGLRSDVVAKPLPAAVRELTSAWAVEQCGVTVQCDADAAADLPVRARYEAMSILAEAMENVARHANARNVEVRLAAQADAVVLTVRDDGRGFPQPSGTDASRRLLQAGHYGLVGLRERAERLGGEVTVTSAPSAGTTIVTRLPISSVDFTPTTGSFIPVEAS